MKGLKYVIVVDTDMNNANVQLQLSDPQGLVEFIDSLKPAADQLGVEITARIRRKTGGTRRL